MNNLFAESGDMGLSVVTLLVYGAVCFGVTAVAVGTASPAGAVMPMVLAGAAWGRALGAGAGGLFDYEGNRHPHVRFYAVMGGAAALAGFFRLPLAVTAMMVEARPSLSPTRTPSPPLSRSLMPALALTRARSRSFARSHSL